MIYRATNKISSALADQISNPREAGVTLLLAILLLSAILSISFSVATVLFIEIRSSAELLPTESSLYAADGVAEQSLFNVIRQVATSTYVSGFTNNTSLNGLPVISSTSTPIYYDTVTYGSNFNNTPNKYDFCNTTATTTGCGYSKLILTYLDTDNPNGLVVYLCQFDPNSNNYNTSPCTSTSTPYWITTSGETTGGGLANPDSPSNINGTLMSAGGVSQLTWDGSHGLDPTKQQELILFYQSNSSDNEDPIHVQISTFGDDASSTPKGLPLLGKTSVSIDATNGQTGRKLLVTVPNPTQ